MVYDLWRGARTLRHAEDIPSETRRFMHATMPKTLSLCSLSVVAVRRVHTYTLSAHGGPYFHNVRYAST